MAEKINSSHSSIEYRESEFYQTGMCKAHIWLVLRLLYVFVSVHLSVAKYKVQLDDLCKNLYANTRKA